MSDVIEGRVDPVVANAAVNAGGKLLKVVAMQNRFGGDDLDSLILAVNPGGANAQLGSGRKGGR